MNKNINQLLFGQSDHSVPSSAVVLSNEPLTKRLLEILPDCHMVERSDNYLTIASPSDVDVIRYKFTERAKWISLCMLAPGSESYINDERFASHKNKKEMFWKIPLKSLDDIDSIVDLIQLSYRNSKYYEEKED